MSQARFQAEVMDEEQQQDERMADAFAEYQRERTMTFDEEQALPAHKRAGYYEQLCDHADYLRKAAKEDAMMQSWCTETEAKINALEKK